MDDFGPATYGDHAAHSYDEIYAGIGSMDPTAAVKALQSLAQGGNALELGVGTGRVAIPLAASGVAVHGIEVSSKMIERLRTKPGADAVTVTQGNFADVCVDGEFSVIYAAFNTFLELTSQDEQVRCFANVSSHLSEGGVFVVETWVPNPSRYENGRGRVGGWGIGAKSVDLEVSEYNLVTQVLRTQHLRFSDDGVQMIPMLRREVWPDEFNLMARIAGLRTLERWSDWHGTPFGPRSTGLIGIYGR